MRIPRAMPGGYKNLKDDESKVDEEPNALFHGGLGTLFVSLAGSGLHFLYHASNCNPLVGLLVAVNESMYEHLKLLIFPVVLWWMVITPLAACLPGNGAFYVTMALTASASAASVVGSAFIAFSYWVEVTLGFEQLWLDILIFCLGALVGQSSGFYVFNKYFDGYGEYIWLKIYLVAPMAIVLLAMYMTFTYLPPAWPLVFQDTSDKNHTFYGVPKC